MKKIRLLFILCLFGLVPIGIFGQTTIPGYHDDDVKALQDFLKFPSASVGKTNGTLLLGGNFNSANFDPADPNFKLTWDTSDPKRLTDVNWSYYNGGNEQADLKGEIDLRNCAELKTFRLSAATAFTGLNVTGLTKLVTVNLSETGVTSLDFTTNTALTALNTRDTPLGELILNPTTTFTTLIITDCKLSLVDIDGLSNGLGNAASAPNLTNAQYAPQDTVKLPVTSLTADISNYILSTLTTTVDWFESDGMTYLTSGYTDQGSGIYVFSEEFVGQTLVCKITDINYPQFGNNTSFTTPFVVKVKLNPTPKIEKVSDPSTSTQACVIDEYRTYAKQPHYDWAVDKGQIIKGGDTDSIVKIRWSQEATGSISVKYKDVEGVESGTGNLSVTIESPPTITSLNYPNTVGCYKSDFTLDVTPGCKDGTGYKASVKVDPAVVNSFEMIYDNSGSPLSLSFNNASGVAEFITIPEILSNITSWDFSLESKVTTETEIKFEFSIIDASSGDTILEKEFTSLILPTTIPYWEVRQDFSDLTASCDSAEFSLFINANCQEGRPVRLTIVPSDPSKNATYELWYEKANDVWAKIDFANNPALDSLPVEFLSDHTKNFRIVSKSPTDQSGMLNLYFKYIDASSGSSIPGLISESVSFYVLRNYSAPATITLEPANAAICEGETHTFSVDATGVKVSYEWFKSGSDTRLSNTKTLSTAEAGNYYVKVKSFCGGGKPDGQPVIRNVSLSVNEPTVVHNTLEDVDICKGSDLVLRVNAEGSNLNYKWFKDGTEITSNTTDSLKITNATRNADYGRYRIEVEGACGAPVVNESRVWVADSVPLPLIFEVPDVAYVGQTIQVHVGLGYGYQDVKEYKWEFGAPNDYFPIQNAHTLDLTFRHATESQYIEVTLDHVCKSDDYTVSKEMKILYPAGIEDTDLSSLQIYPNPVSDILNVSFAATGDIISDIVITNMQGQIVYQSQPYSTDVVIAADKFPSGVCFVKVTDDKGKSVISKIIKE